MTTTDRGPMGAFEGYGECDTPDPVPATNQAGEVERLRAALTTSMIAIDDWLHTYAAELCHQSDVDASATRIGQFGTLAYIAHVQDGNRTALATQPATSQEGASALVKRMADRETDRGGCLDIVSWLTEADRLAATPTRPTLSEDLREARPMSDEAKTGERVLVHFAGKGWITVSWEDPYGDGGYPIWCVDDDMHDPYPLRGYREGDDTHWMPLPAAPAALAQVKAP